jgi:hypothetical protein
MGILFYLFKFYFQNKNHVITPTSKKTKVEEIKNNLPLSRSGVSWNKVDILLI